MTMNKSRFVTVIALSVALVLQSCVFADAQIIWLSSTKKADFTNCDSETRQLRPFDAINNESSIDIIYVQSDVQSVIVQGDEPYFNKLHTDVSNGRLTIKMDKGNYRNLRLRVKISTPDIRSITMAGSGDLICDSDISTDDKFTISLAGSSDVSVMAVKANDFNVSVTGSGDISIESVETGTSDVSLAGSGDVRIERITADDLRIGIAGSGDINIGKAVIADDTDISLAGSGDVKINGRTDKVTVSVVGSGDVTGKFEYNSIKRKKAGTGDITFY